MYWAYILESESSGKLYYGTSKNPKKRLINHNLGKQRWTKQYLPWKLITKIRVKDKITALKIEKKLKSLKNPKYIKKLIIEGKVAQLVSPDLSGFT